MRKECQGNSDTKTPVESGTSGPQRFSVDNWGFFLEDEKIYFFGKYK